jgi:hypothetical protein
MKRSIAFLCKALSLAFIVFVSSACIASRQHTEVMTSTNVSQSPTPTPKAEPTVISAEMPLPLPYMTPVPPTIILAEFPLAVGASWNYSAEISYMDPNDKEKLTSWTGFVIDTITEKKEAVDGSLIFSMKEELVPKPPIDVWRQPSTFEYSVSGNGVLEYGSKIYQWPLSNRLRWKWDANFGYEKEAVYQEKVDTPYGQIKGCYVIFLFTNPDISIDTFCPKIGFVEHSYKHHGTPQNEHFVLVSYTPGKK